jgi:hypothetical protein
MNLDDLYNQLYIADQEGNTEEANRIAQTIKYYESVGTAESAIRGAGQSLAFDFMDEITGGLETAKDYITGDISDEESLLDRYKKRRDESRLAYDVAQEINPKSYATGAVVGAVLPTPLSALRPIKAATMLAKSKSVAPLAKSIIGGIGHGAVDAGLYSIGSSEDLKNPQEIAEDIKLGMLYGGGIPLGGKAIKTIAPLAGKKIMQAGRDLKKTSMGTRLNMEIQDFKNFTDKNWNRLFETSNKYGVGKTFKRNNAKIVELEDIAKKAGSDIKNDLARLDGLPNAKITAEDINDIIMDTMDSNEYQKRYKDLMGYIEGLKRKGELPNRFMNKNYPAELQQDLTPSQAWNLVKKIDNDYNLYSTGKIMTDGTDSILSKSARLEDINRSIRKKIKDIDPTGNFAENSKIYSDTNFLKTILKEGATNKLAKKMQSNKSVLNKEAISLGTLGTAYYMLGPGTSLQKLSTIAAAMGAGGLWNLSKQSVWPRLKYKRGSIMEDIGKNIDRGYSLDLSNRLTRPSIRAEGVLNSDVEDMEDYYDNY